MLSDVLNEIDQCFKKHFEFLKYSNKKHLPMSQKMLRKAKRNVS